MWVVLCIIFGILWRAAVLFTVVAAIALAIAIVTSPAWFQLPPS